MKKTILTILIIIIIMLFGVYLYMFFMSQKIDKQIKELSSYSSLGNTASSDEEEIIYSNSINAIQDEESFIISKNNVSYMELQIDNSDEKEELSYTDPIKLEDTEIQKYILGVINDSELYQVSEDEVLDFESSPILTIYTKKDEKITMCGKYFENQYIFYLSRKEDMSDKVFYKTNSGRDLENYLKLVYRNNV